MNERVMVIQLALFTRDYNSRVVYVLCTYQWKSPPPNPGQKPCTKIWQVFIARESVLFSILAILMFRPFDFPPKPPESLETKNN